VSAFEDDEHDVELLTREPLLRSYLEVDRVRFRHRLFAGGMSGEVSREVLLRGAAVVVMPYDRGRDRVVLVEQFRIGAYVNGEPAWLLEAIAGLVEPGEQPAAVAIREAREEAGLELAQVNHALDFYPSPGALSEKAMLFWALADTEGVGGVHGLDHEHEDIRVHVMEFAEAMRAVREGRIRSATGLVALQWLALNRERLRNED
jgi:ADP-ribose pyrophosphatase